MMTQVHHIGRITVALLILVAAMAAGFTSATADDSKRVVTRGRSAVPTSAIQYATPTIGAYEVIMNALGRQNIAPPAVVAKPKVNKTQVLKDKPASESSIVKAHASSSDVFKATIELAKDEASIDLGVYNMLGKRMMTVYNGSADAGKHEYTASTSELPEGVYICILQGGNVRRAAKFYLNR